MLHRLLLFLLLCAAVLRTTAPVQAAPDSGLALVKQADGTYKQLITSTAPSKAGTLLGHLTWAFARSHVALACPTSQVGCCMSRGDSATTCREGVVGRRRRRQQHRRPAPPLLPPGFLRVRRSLTPT